jgi:predicted lipid-binding transport protein (Tim44 family)
MYCSSCGAAIAQGLSYCNHCGAKLIGEKSESLAKSSEMRPASLLWGMVAALVFGIFTITLLLMAMKMVGLNVGQIMAFMMVSFMTLLLVEGMFIRQLLRRQRGAEEAGDKLLSKQQATKELEAAQARVLPEAMPSVTEHTTRSFEPIYRERK